MDRDLFEDPDFLAFAKPEPLMRHTEAIAQHVRLSGSDGEAKAFDYIEQQLRQLPNVTVQRLTHDAYVSWPIEAELKVGDRAIDCYTCAMGASTGSEGLDLELFDAAASAPDQGRGCLWLMSGLPSVAKVIEAQAGGAAAAAFYGDDHLHWTIVSPVWGSPAAEDLDRLPRLPVLSLRGPDGRDLLQQLAQDHGLRAYVRTVVDTRWRQTPLLTADIIAKNSEDFVLLSGHVDSWAFGAMDNGSANAAMLELTRLFADHAAQLRRGLRVAFWSGHSHGRYSGSSWYADNHFQELLRHMAAHVNVDSLGGEGASVLTEAIVMAELQELAAAAVGAETDQHFVGRRVGRMGDQSFVSMGVSSIFMSLSEQPPSDDATSRALSQRLGGKASGGLGWWWHTADDLPQHVDAKGLVRDTRVYARVLGALLMNERLPLHYVASAAEVESVLKAMQKAAGSAFDLSAALAAAARAKQALLRLYSADIDARRFNDALLRLARPLVDANYSKSDRYWHDPALPQGALPGLTPILGLTKLSQDAQKHQLVGLRREANRIEDLLLEVEAIAQNALTL